MRAVVMRVKSASVEVDSKKVGNIGQGLLVYLGVGPDDDKSDIDWLAEKVYGLRIFSDDGGKFNLSLGDVGGQALVVSQFTLFGDCRRGKRPSFSSAAPPELAERLYDEFCIALEKKGAGVQRGIFAADMQVASVNDGPVTMLIDSKKLF